MEYEFPWLPEMDGFEATKQFREAEKASGNHLRSLR
jgi:hypothetical protein